MKSISVWARYLRRFAGRIWYLPLMAFLAASDLFILVIPTDFLIISYVLLRPQRWIAALLWVSIGSAVGALVLAGIIQYGGEALLMNWFPGIFKSGNWTSTATFLQNHGWAALALISASFLPQQPGVVVSALSRMPLGVIFLAVLSGRLLKYAIFTWCASHAPRFLTKFKIGRVAIKETQISLPKE